MITEFSKRVGIPELQILDGGRSTILIELRFLYWLLLLENGYSMKDIARLSGFHRTTVVHGIGRIRELLGMKDKRIVRLYELTKDITREGTFHTISLD